MMIAGLDLCRRIERSEAHALRRLLEFGRERFPELHITVTELDGVGIAGYAGQDSPFNQAVGIQRDLDEREIDEIVGFYRSRSSATAIVLASFVEGDLRERLLMRGFEQAGSEHALVVDLAGRPLSFDPRVEVCVNSDEWADHSAITFGAGYAAEPLRFISGLMASDPSVTALAIREYGQILSTACLGKERDGIASLFADATSPWARGRGFQSALIADRMARARSAGATLARATANPSTSSERNYRKNGFEVLYSRTAWILRK